MPESKNRSCIPKEPLIKLDDKGIAPIIKYKMPHDTSYSAKSFTPLNIEEKCFKSEHTKDGNFSDYERFENRDIDAIAKILHIEFGNFKRRHALSNLKDQELISKPLLEMKKEVIGNMQVEPLNP